MLFDRRITIFVGHFGSGKTEIAVNSAIGLATAGTPVALVDIDVIKPMFRTRTARDELAAAGVKLIVPEGEHFHADLPIIVPQVRSMVRESTGKVLMDAGGDDKGARVLGSLSDVVKPDDIDHLLVVNFRRPFSETVELALEMLAAIETSSRLRVTGLIANTHLMNETTLDIVEDGVALARETARRAGRPLVAAAAVERFADDLAARCPDVPVIRITPRIRAPFDQQPRPRRIGPLFALRR